MNEETVKKFEKLNSELTEREGTTFGLYGQAESPRKFQLTQGGYYYNSETDVHVRPPFSEDNYGYYRADEAIPRGGTQPELHQVMDLCHARK